MLAAYNFESGRRVTWGGIFSRGLSPGDLSPGGYLLRPPLLYYKMAENGNSLLRHCRTGNPAIVGHCVYVNSDERTVYLLSPPAEVRL